MQLQCRTCRQPIAAADVNIALGIAKCAICNGVFSFLEDLGGLAAPREIVKLPKRFQVDHWGSELVITKRWFGGLKTQSQLDSGILLKKTAAGV